MANEKQLNDDKKTNGNNKKMEVLKDYKNNRSGKWLGIVIVAIVVAGGLFIMGAVADHAMNFNRERGQAIMAGGGFLRGGNDFGRRPAMGQTLNTNQVQISGVVTAVNGQSFTVAGNGSTNTVQTNSDTQYVNGSKVSVNDSVMVVGTTNGGTFTAAQVAIYNTQ